MRAFYEQCLWIPQPFLLTNPDLHHRLLSKNVDVSPSSSTLVNHSHSYFAFQPDVRGWYYRRQW
jgi:hypothetical protein